MTMPSAQGGTTNLLAFSRERGEGKHFRAFRVLLTLAACVALILPAFAQEQRGTGDLGLVIERAKGSIQLLDTSKKIALQRVEGLGDLSHASAVFSRDARFAYVFGRDGGLSKIDLLTGTYRAGRGYCCQNGPYCDLLLKFEGDTHDKTQSKLL